MPFMSPIPEMIHALMNNAALLVVLVYVIDLLLSHHQHRIKRHRNLLAGVVVGVTGIIVMLARWTLEPGVAFDTRSVLLGISGLFLGPIPTGIAMAMTSGFRILQGGSGTLTGVCVILASGGIGLAWRRFRRPDLARISALELYVMGLALHVSMLLLFFLLPHPEAIRILQGITLPVIVIYPLATMLLGKLMATSLQREENRLFLKDSESKYRGLFENNHTIMLILDPDTGQILDANPRATTFYGWPREVMKTKKISDLHLVPDHHAFDAMKRASLSPSTPLEFKHQCADGQIRDVEVHCGQVISEGRKVLYSILYDVSDRRKMERDKNAAEHEIQSMLQVAQESRLALLSVIEDQKRAEEEILKLTAAVEQSPVSIVITDLDGNIDYVNPRFTQVTGYSLDEVKGSNPRVLKSNETPPETYAELWRTITSGHEWRGELHNKKKNGASYWERVAISPILDQKGKIIRFLAMKEDITEQKQLEDQFRQAQKMDAVGRLAGGVAHDFNNKLQTIIGFTDLALMKLPAHSPLQDDLMEIKEAAQRSADLTRQLLAFARKDSASPRVLDLNHTIDTMLKMLKRLIGEHIELTWAPASSLWRVWMDPSQVDQILANLSVNARDAMENGGTLIIETANKTVTREIAQQFPDATPGDYVMIIVSDTGVGIPSENLTKLFEPFFTTKGLGKGTGLGLPSVYGIVRQNQGFIATYSEVGHGTTFKIYLPRTGQAAGAGRPKVEPEPTPGTETILVVEDDPAILGLTKRALSKYGYSLYATIDPEAALQIAREHKIDLLVTDVVMPGMSGKALAANVANIQPGTKVLFVSGYTADVVAKQGLIDPNLYFLQKPFSNQQLAATIRDILDAESTA